MPRTDFFKCSKRNGSVLVAALLLGLCACALSLLCLATAHKTAVEQVVFAEALKRENIAREALELTREYFIAESVFALGGGVDSNGSRRNQTPITVIPASLFDHITTVLPGVVIKGEAIDLNYADSFAEEARRQGIPAGLTSLITVGEDGGEEIIFRAGRYELRVTVILGSAPEKSYMMRQGVLLLTGIEDGSFHELTLYIKK